MSLYPNVLRTITFLCILCLSAVNVSAHAAIVWAYAEGDSVFVEAFFANGTKIQDTKVIVLDKNKKIVTEGKTNSKGEFTYKPVSKEPQTIVVIAGESHIGDFELTEEDLQDLGLPPKQAASTQGNSEELP